MLQAKRRPAENLVRKTLLSSEAEWEGNFLLTEVLCSKLKVISHPYFIKIYESIRMECEGTNSEVGRL